MHLFAKLSGWLILAVIAISGCNSDNADAANEKKASSRVEVYVSAQGYSPNVIEAKAGEPLTLVFKRKNNRNCGQFVVFPNHGIQRQLPVGQDVQVELIPKENERIPFTCQMGMYRGMVIATRS